MITGHSKYIKNFKESLRPHLKSLFEKCNDTNQNNFKRIYKTVDNIKDKHLDHAIFLVEEALEKQ